MPVAVARHGRWVVVYVLVTVVLVFAVIRVSIDVPNVRSGVLPAPGLFDRRYAEHAALAYAHIAPGLVYLLAATLQLNRRFRERHLVWHRRIGRVALPAGIVSGVFAVVFGGLYSFGGAAEAVAAVLFGVYFTGALLLAYRAVRRGDVTHHRRWMIRAFAVALAVGTIRLWIGLFQAFGVLSFRDSFAVAFWLALVSHALVAEVYLARRPGADGRPAHRPAGARPLS